MQLDHKRAEEKRQELIAQLDGAVSNARDGHADLGVDRGHTYGAAICDQFVEIAPPEQEMLCQELIVMGQGGRRGGRSYKPGNILLDIRKLFTAVASGVLTVAGAVAHPWTVPFAAIILWNSLWCGLEREISEREAAVLWTIWQNRNDSSCVSKRGLLKHVNVELRKYGRRPISAKVLEDSLSMLKDIGSIEESSDKKHWWLREWVRVPYR